MSLYRLVFLLSILVTIFTPAQADEGRAYNQVRLSATVERAIAPDLMRITLYSEGRDEDAARLAQKTTQSLNAAIEKARLVKGITIQSGAHHSYPVYDTQGQNIMAWQERAELHLEARDFAALAALSADLMQELKIANHHFLISKPLLRETENSLIEEAIAAFGDRAQIITKALGGQSYKIVQLGFDGQDRIRPLFAQRSMEMMMTNPVSDSATPQIEAGTSDITVSLQGLIEVEMK